MSRCVRVFPSFHHPFLCGGYLEFPLHKMDELTVKIPPPTVKIPPKAGSSNAQWAPSLLSEVFICLKPIIFCCPIHDVFDKSI